MKLIFVYNADSGFFNQLGDFAHKIFSPKTYSCSLCMMTYGNFGMKGAWKSFLETLPYEKVFLHKDEFEYKDQFELPAIFIDKGKTEVLVSANELNAAKNLSSVIELMTKKLATSPTH